MEDDGREEWLQDYQGGRAYPLGRALRETYDADNHATLDSDVTGLMIDLSKVPYEPAAIRAPEPAVPPPAASAVRPSILARLGGLLGWR